VHFDSKALGSLVACTVNPGPFNLDERSRGLALLGMEMHVLYCTKTLAAKQSNQSINREAPSDRPPRTSFNPSLSTYSPPPSSIKSYSQPNFSTASISTVQTSILLSKIPPRNPAPHPHLRKRKVRSKQGGIRRRCCNQGRGVTYLLRLARAAMQCAAHMSLPLKPRNEKKDQKRTSGDRRDMQQNDYLQYSTIFCKSCSASINRMNGEGWYCREDEMPRGKGRP
jgi:hypothetical protein